MFERHNEEPTRLARIKTNLFESAQWLGRMVSKSPRDPAEVAGMSESEAAEGSMTTNDATVVHSPSLTEQYNWLSEQFRQEFGEEVDSKKREVGRILFSLGSPAPHAGNYRLTPYVFEVDAGREQYANAMLRRIGRALNFSRIGDAYWIDQNHPMTVTGIREMSRTMLDDPHANRLSELTDYKLVKERLYAPHIASTVSVPTLIMRQDESRPELLAVPVTDCPGAVVTVMGEGAFAPPNFHDNTMHLKRPIRIGFSLYSWDEIF